MKILGPQPEDFGRVWIYQGKLGLAKVELRISCTISEKHTAISKTEVSVTMLGRSVFEYHLSGDWNHAENKLLSVQGDSEQRVGEGLFHDPAGFFLSAGRVLRAEGMYNSQILLDSGKSYFVSSSGTENPDKFDVFVSKSKASNEKKKRGSVIFDSGGQEILVFIL